MHREVKNAYNITVENSKRKYYSEDKCRWEDIEANVTDMSWDDVALDKDWWKALVSMVIKLWFP
jgi:hypothetical protein